VAAFTQLGAPVDITPTEDGTYQDIDVTAHVSNASGVLIRAFNGESAAKRDIAVRKNGSTDDYYQGIGAQEHAYFAVGIDSSDIFECKLENSAGDWEIYLVGYFDADDVVFLDNAVESPSTTGSWTDWDITSETGVDTAIGAICFIYCHSSSLKEVGVRKNGSTDDRTNDVGSGSLTGGIIVGVDDSEILEYYRETNYVDVFLIGYVKSGMTFNTDASDISLGTTGSWTDLSSLGSDIEGIIVEVVSPTANYAWGLRPDGDADYDGDYADITQNHGWGVCGTVSDIAEGKIENTAVDMFLIGTIDSDTSGTITGSGALTEPAGSISGSGTREITGSGALTEQPGSISGIATREITGSGALSEPVGTISGTGSVGNIITGSGALVEPAGSISGSGTREITGSGVLLEPSGEISGSGAREITGSGALVEPVGSVSGSGTREITGSGALVEPPGTITGRDQPSDIGGGGANKGMIKNLGKGMS
jgi:hypothetical protein